MGEEGEGAGTIILCLDIDNYMEKLILKLVWTSFDLL